MKPVAIALLAALVVGASAAAASAECTDTTDRLREAFLDGRASRHLLPDRYLIGPHDDVSPDGSRLLYGDGGFIVERLDGSSSRELPGGWGGKPGSAL